MLHSTVNTAMDLTAGSTHNRQNPRLNMKVRGVKTTDNKESNRQGNPNLHWKRLAGWLSMRCIQGRLWDCCCTTVGKGRLLPFPRVRLQQLQWVYLDLGHLQGGISLSRQKKPLDILGCIGMEAWIWHNLVQVLPPAPQACPTTPRFTLCPSSPCPGTPLPPSSHPLSALPKLPCLPRKTSTLYQFPSPWRHRHTSMCWPIFPDCGVQVTQHFCEILRLVQVICMSLRKPVNLRVQS